MAKYRFRLETLQKVREIRRNDQRVRLAQAYHAADVLAEQHQLLSEELAELRRQQNEAYEGTHLDVNRLTAAGLYEPVLKSRQEMLGNQQELLDAEIERRRAALLEADRNVRVLELLDERGREVHRQAEQRVEGKQMDEVANIASWRRQNES